MPLVGQAPSSPTAPGGPSPKYVTDKVIVRFRPSTSAAQMHATHVALGAAVLSNSTLVDRLQVVQLGLGTSVHEAIRAYRASPNVLYAEPDYIVHTTGVPTDPFFSTQWNMRNTGQSGGTAGADIKANLAWDISTGSSDVIVAVLDTGIDYNHPDLVGNVWTTPNGFTTTSINGIPVVCEAGSHGLNVVDSTCDPFDDNGHGTHVSGTIGAVGNNGTGVAGVNWNVQILPCKMLDSRGSGDILHALACLSFVQQLKDSGANIVVSNNSWGGGLVSQALLDAIAAQMADGILFVAAAGNEFSDNDISAFFPANIFLPNVISVAATTRFDEIVAFSDIGKHTVHLGAPGHEILSTTPFNTYSILSGTSMAAPHVSGVAALLKAQDPTRDWRTIKNLILSGGDTLPAMAATISNKRLNAFGSMTCSNSLVRRRLIPIPATVTASAGSPVVLSFLNINCGQPAGDVAVAVSPGNSTVTLTDDGAGNDQAAGDGIYTGQFVPSALGSYQLQFPDGSTVGIEVLSPYGFTRQTFNYQNITGPSLDLGDDGVARIDSPFPIHFGGGTFNQLFVSSNGTISVTEPFGDFVNRFLTAGGFPVFVQGPTTLVAPWWTDLYPVKGTAQNVFWQVVGAAPARQLVVEWRNVRSFLCRSDAAVNITFEAIFNEASNDVQFNYADSVFAGDCILQDYGQGATIGIQSSPTNGIMWGAMRSDATGSGTSLLWQSPPASGTNSPVPILGSMAPTSAPIFSPDVLLTVNGSGFTLNSLVQWNSLNLPTTWVSPTQLTAVLPSTLFTPLSNFNSGTTPQITVFNPAPGGGTSLPLLFNIVSTTALPSISSVSPSSAVAGGFSFSFAATGNNLGNATLFWNGTALASFSPSNTEAIGLVSSALITAPGTVQITAVGPAGVSNNVPFTITAPAPATPATQPQQAISIDSSGKTTPSFYPSRIQFLGWNYGRTKGGPAYLKHFARPFGGGLLPPAQLARPNFDGVRGTATSASVDLNLPASLPGFAFHPTLPAGYIPTSLVAGDFNKDGKMDWAVSNGGDNSLWLYLGNGDGTSQLPVIMPVTGASPLQVVAADLRKIGILDLIVAEGDSQTIGVFLGNGDGTFAPEVTYFVSRPPLSVAVGDFNGDGKLDIGVGFLGDEFSGPLATMLGDGTGKFGSPITFLADNSIFGSFATIHLIAADLNGDGLSDLVTNDVGGLQEFEGAHVYLSHGDGTFKNAGVFDGGAISVALGDVTEDGCLDAVTADPLGLVSVFKGSCDGTFEGFPGVFLVGNGEQPINIALADMDGDGHLDVVTSGAFFGSAGPFGQDATNLITVLRGDGHGHLGVSHVFRGEPSMLGLALGDLNGDGHPDVMVASQDTDTSAVFLNDGHGSFSAPYGEYIGYQDGANFGAVNAPLTDFFIRDIDGDGKPDLALVESPQFFQSPWKLAVTLNDGTGHFGPAIRSTIGDAADFQFGYALADFRGTGRPDLVLFEFDPIFGTNPAVSFSANLGQGNFAPPVTTSLGPSLISQFGILAAGDFNGDGKMDFVVAGLKATLPGTPGGLEIVSFAGNGDGTFQQVASQTTTQAVLNARAIFAGDFNHDGKLDLLVWIYDNTVGRLNHNVYEFLGNGDGTFQPAKLLFPDFGRFTVADLNHDGLFDIVEYVEPLTTLTDLNPVGFNIYLGRPDGTFQLVNTYQPYPGLFSSSYTFDNGSPQQRFGPMVADFNGDGNLDIAAFQFAPTFPVAQTYVQILAGNGDGSFVPTFAAIPFHKVGIPSSVADVTGDGRADLLEVDGFVSSFHVIPGAPGESLQLSLPVRPILGTTGTLVIDQSLVAGTPSNITLSASDPNIAIPPVVTIPAGSLGTTVPFTLGPGFDASRPFSLSAQLGTQTAVIYSHKTTALFSGFHAFINPVSMTVPPGGANTNGIGVISYGGYSSPPILLSCEGLPQGASCIFTPSSLDVKPGAGNSASILVQAATDVPIGAYSFSAVATDGVITEKVPLRLKVADFTVDLAPKSVTVLAGKTAEFSLTVGALGGWSDFVNVNCEVLQPNLSCPFGGPIVFPGTYPSLFPTDGLVPGDYEISVSANADSVTHASPIAVLHVQGVTSSFSSGPATIPVGGSASFNLSLNSVNGFSDVFTFSCPGLPSGLSCGFTPGSGNLPANGTLATQLNISVTSKPASDLPFSADRTPRWYLIGPIFGTLAACLSMLLLLNRRGRRVVALAAVLVLGIVLLGVPGCGGGGGSSSPSPGPPTPTPTPTPTPPQSRVVSVVVRATSSTLDAQIGVITVTIP